MCNLNPKIAGKLRRKDVGIIGKSRDGKSRLIREILAKGNTSRLREWCEKYKECKNLNEVKEAHIDFEMVHPFMDGNGRTGRILYNVQRVYQESGINVFYEKDKTEYYKWFAERQREEDLIKLMSEL
jgi:Fic family protein